MIVVAADRWEDQRNGTACQQGVDNVPLANHHWLTGGQAGAYDDQWQVKILDARGSEHIGEGVAHPDWIDETESSGSRPEHFLDPHAARQFRHLLGGEAGR